MKTEIVGELTQENEIDWSKPMVVSIFEGSAIIAIIASNGRHEGRTFEGMLIHGKTFATKTMDFRKDWVKSSFKPITNPITIKFSNE